jgi:hypothetical protein
MSHDSIQSAPEPWILLPYMQILSREGSFAKYSERASNRAVENFIQNSPIGKSGFTNSLRSHLQELYASYCESGEVYFLDKTPRYYHYIDEIISIFPDAKFVFLFRNQIAVYNSILSTFCQNSFRFFPRYYHDIYSGFGLLSDGYSRHKDNVHAIKYEDLVNEPEVVLKEVLSFLNLDYKEELLESLCETVFEKSTMGDPTGQFEYSKVENKTIHKWKKNSLNPVRKIVLLNFLHGHSEAIYNHQGYDKSELIKSVKSQKVVWSRMLTDVFGLFACMLILKLKINMLFGKDRNRWFLS